MKQLGAFFGRVLNKPPPGSVTASAEGGELGISRLHAKGGPPPAVKEPMDFIYLSSFQP